MKAFFALTTSVTESQAAVFYVIGFKQRYNCLRAVILFSLYLPTRHRGALRKVGGLKKVWWLKPNKKGLSGGQIFNILHFLPKVEGV